VLHAVVDVSVFVSSLIRRNSVPADVLRAWENGHSGLVASPAPLTELDNVLRRPHIEYRIAPDAAPDLVALIRSDAIVVDDPASARHVESDPDDDYLITLALAAGAHVVITGDTALLGLDLRWPRILTPRDFLAALEPLA